MGGGVDEPMMWPSQSRFRRSVETDVQKSLAALGVTVEPTVFLVGLSIAEGSDNPLRVEPPDGPVVPADFDHLNDRARELYHQNPDSQLEYSPAWVGERQRARLLNQACGDAISEFLAEKVGLQFFAGVPTPVNDYLVFIVVGLPRRVLDAAPHLLHDKVEDRYALTRSLIHGAVEEVLRLGSKALYHPNPGSDLDEGVQGADIAKRAAGALTRSAMALAGNMTGGRLFDGLNRLVTTRYERRIGVGSLLLASRDSEYIERALTLRQSVSISETRTVRKLLETSSRNGASLLTDGDVVYGLGRLREADYPKESESVFQLLVTGDGVWDLLHAENPLATVEFGEPRLPEQLLRRDQLDDICGRVFDGQHDGEVLWRLAEAAKQAEHGTMLVISEVAEEEAARMGNQALPIEPTFADSFIEQATAIDGGVLVDPLGRCHAIGVILDGAATGQGDRARGSRFNSAVRYLASAKAEGKRTVILLVSEDGMINLLPDLRPRIRRAERDALVADLREAAALDPVDAERFYKAYDRVEAKAFYLSEDQIEEVNAMMEDHWERRKAQGAKIWIVQNPLVFNAEMTDDYLID